MCERPDGPGPSFEAFVSDPLIRLVMASDGVTEAEMRDVLRTVRAAICARDTPPTPRLVLVE